MVSLVIGKPAMALGEQGLDLTRFYAQEITEAKLVGDNEFRLVFQDGATLTIHDAGQKCCDHRYITCDDDPKSLVGGKLYRIELKEGVNNAGKYGDYNDTMFVEIATDKAFITLCTHNEYNGYYGGFDIVLTGVENADA